jgi:plastocyanin
VAPAHAVDYRDVLEAYPGNSVTWTTVATMPHDVQLSKEGLRALEAALLGAV